MAVGDVVSDVSASNTAIDFQPAAGVEVVVTAYGMDGVATQGNLSDGSETSLLIATGTQGQRSDQTKTKVFVGNDVFLNIVALGVGVFGSFCGITTV